MHETHPYQRVLALINFDGADEKIACKALLLARLNQAQLVFLHLIEADAAMDGGYPVSSPQADAAALEAGARRRLDFLATRLGAVEAECIARCGPARQGFQQQLNAWRPDLVVSAQDLGFVGGPHDVLILGHSRKMKGGGLIGRLTAWLSAQTQPRPCRTQ